jgi:hypothetical protein
MSAKISDIGNSSGWLVKVTGLLELGKGTVTEGISASSASLRFAEALTLLASVCKETTERSHIHKADSCAPGFSPSAYWCRPALLLRLAHVSQPKSLVTNKLINLF